MSWGGDEFVYDIDSRYPESADMQMTPLTERARARRQGVEIADGIAKGYGPLNVRQTSWPEQHARYEQQGISSQYRYSAQESPIPWHAQMRRDDVDMRSLKMDQSWEETCKAPTRPAKTIGRYSEAMLGGVAVPPMPGLSDPNLILMFVFFLLLIVLAQAFRMIWSLNSDLGKLREKIAKVESKIPR
jgi:hypothetical protein